MIKSTENTGGAMAVNPMHSYGHQMNSTVYIFKELFKGNKFLDGNKNGIIPPTEERLRACLKHEYVHAGDNFKFGI